MVLIIDPSSRGRTLQLSSKFNMEHFCANYGRLHLPPGWHHHHLLILILGHYTITNGDNQAFHWLWLSSSSNTPLQRERGTPFSFFRLTHLRSIRSVGLLIFFLSTETALLHIATLENALCSSGEGETDFGLNSKAADCINVTGRSAFVLQIGVVGEMAAFFTDGNFWGAASLTWDCTFCAPFSMASFSSE